MVYIVKSNQSSENYDNWVCGGALISEWQVLTAASCLTEMSHVYVIAGYRKYINGRGIEEDACTRTRKNRVVKTCVPKSYNLTHEDQSKWMALDIGVATVETPYNFSDKSWHRHCSYVPQAIRISYDSWFTNKNTDVVAFGWGGTHWRTATDVLDNNSQYLNEIAGIVVIKSVCKEAFDAQEVHNVIQKYMLCVAEGGNLNGDGTLRDVGPKTRTGCRRSGNNTGCTSDIVSENTPVEKQPIPSRRQALCQNDHGGPLVTWRGSEEVLIGVACSSIVDVNTLACRPPSLFTSVFCTGSIIACLIARTKQARRACSEKIKTDGLHIQEIDINWGGLDEDYFACVNQRRLTNGKRTKVGKPYMVYLVQSNQSSKNLDNYLCAGALISQWQILTAAACLMELTHMYAIAGYKKYVNGRGIDYDECTRTKKNRVMKTCVPKDYHLSYTNRSGYVSLDIGVAFVEHRYDPKDISWLDDCTYIPKPIRISYAAELIEPGNDVVAFGWGGSFYRTSTDVLDNNSPFLQEISTLIISKQKCKSHFKTYADNMWNAIDMYMVCAEGVGNLDGDGNMISIGSTSNSGCHRRDGSGCDRDNTRRKSGARHANKSAFHQPVPSRRQSLCQNDHGAPLITWMGSEEVLIGIGASSVVDAKQLFCMAPSLFTSTHCVGKVVECLTALTKDSRRRCAEGIKTQGIGIQDIDFDWDKMPEVPNADLDPNSKLRPLFDERFVVIDKRFVVIDKFCTKSNQ